MERCKLPRRGLGGAPAEIEFRAFWPKNLTSGGDKFNDFPDNQLTKFRLLQQSAAAARGPLKARGPWHSAVVPPAKDGPENNIIVCALFCKSK